jgi:flagellar biosynthesis protein FlhB
MSAESSSEDRTEQPTDRRLEDARKKGQIPRSRELSLTLMLVLGSAGLLIIGDDIAVRMRDLMVKMLTLSRRDLAEPSAMFYWVQYASIELLWCIAPFVALMVVAAIAGPLALGGWNFSWEALEPKWEKMNPLAGFARMFGLATFVEIPKALLKTVLVGGVAIFYLWGHRNEVFALSELPLQAALMQSMDLFFWCFLILSSVLILVGGIDAPYQFWQHYRQLKMTFQEVRDEAKETDGRPEVKGRIRQMQRQISQRRMMENVPKADVVVTNPTHFAVALQYDKDKMKAPKVVAKGADEIAFKIREIAKAHQVMVFEEPPLARALYHTAKLDKEVPQGLYVAVAQVLAYVYQLRVAVRQRGVQRPQRPRPKLPAEYQQYVEMGVR